MANTIDWGQAAVNNTNGFGKAPTNNTNDFGEVCADSWSPETNLVGGSSFSNLQSLEFDGIDDYVDCGNIPQIKNNTEMTLSFWAKIEDTSRRILFGQNLVAGNDIFQLYYWTADILYIWIKNGGTGTVSFVNTSGIINIGEWYHFTMVFNGSLTNDDRCKLFLNGGSDIITNRGIMPTAFPNSDEPFLIGRGTNGYFQGNIDEVAVWNSDQSSNVSSIYNGGIPTDLSSLSPLSWWRFEGTGTTATDSGSGGHDGTLTNGVTRSTDVPT